MATQMKTAAKKTAAEAETQSETTADVMSFGNPAEWAVKAKEQFETMFSSFSDNFEEIRDQAEEMAETAQSRMKLAHEHATKVNSRIVEAAQEEMSGAIQLASDLGKARTFADALTIQQSYWAKLFETRMSNAREITEAAVSVARETMSPVESPFAANMKAFEKMFAFPLKG